MLGEMETLVSSSEGQVDLVSAPSGAQESHGACGKCACEDETRILSGPVVRLFEHSTEGEGQRDGNSECQRGRSQAPHDGRIEQAVGHAHIALCNGLEHASVQSRDLNRSETSDPCERLVCCIVLARDDLILLQSDDHSIFINMYHLAVDCKGRSCELRFRTQEKDQEETNAGENGKDPIVPWPCQIDSDEGTAETEYVGENALPLNLAISYLTKES